ncbi:MAG: hypothetical protein ACNA8W_18380 [Bradymonadaceae bacterium]
MFLFKNAVIILAIVAMTVSSLTACGDVETPTEPIVEAERVYTTPVRHRAIPRLAGQVVQTINNVVLEGDRMFMGGIVGLRLDRVNDDIVASGRIVARVDGEQVIEPFEDVVVTILDETGEPITPNGECPERFFLDLEPIIFDVVGRMVVSPDPLVVEIRPEVGPESLIGTRICALLGLQD